MKYKILTFLFLIILITSCQSQNTETPYKVGNAYLYKVTVKDPNATVLMTDTLRFTIKNKGLLGGVLGMNMATWTSTKYPNNEQERGVNLDKNTVEIQPPLRYDYLENENIVIAGYPSFSTSMLVDYQSESDHLFPKSYGSLAGKEFKQHKIVLDSATAKYKNKKLDCKVTSYKNLNFIDEFGQYQLTAFYQNDYGFLKLKYRYPNGKEINFELIDIKT